MIAITGAGGWLGSRCVETLRAAGKQVRRLTRRPHDPDQATFVLGAPVDPTILAGAETLIHAAHDFGAVGAAEMRRVNIEGSLALLRAAREAKVGRLVFVSSVSAFEGCRSLYGRAKLEIETAFLAAGGTVVRPGLIYGDKGRGMFAALAKLSRLPVLPLVGGGRQPLMLVHIQDVAGALATTADWAAGTVKDPVIFAHPERVAIKDVLRASARAQGRRFLAVPVPEALALAGLRALEAAGLPLRARSDSLLGLLHWNPQPDFSWQAALGLKFRRFLDQDPTA